MDNQTWGSFRADYSVEEMEIRFDFEEERLNQGLSITNKDFYTKLKEVIKNGKQTFSVGSSTEDECV